MHGKSKYGLKETTMKLGMTAKDLITGYTGVITAWCEFHNNCDRIALQPRELTSDGKVQERTWFDITQLEVVDEAVIGFVQAPEHEFKMLDEVRDTITGHKGIITSFTTWLSGCIRAGVQNKEVKDGRPVDDWVVPVQQLEMIKAYAPITVKPKTGGPMDPPKYVRDPK